MPFAALAAGFLLLAPDVVVGAKDPSVAHAAPIHVTDDAYRAALDLLYDGSTETALDTLRTLAVQHPDDPLGLYLQALALCWKIEQRPDTTALDPQLEALINRTLAVADTQLRASPDDARARLARGGALAVRSRLCLFRLRSRDAARAAVGMRAELLALKGHEPEWQDAQFGVGLYDFYVDVLPRFVKLLRFISGLPGGNRERGLAAIEAAQEHSAFHRIEAAAQLYDIYCYYDPKPDRALAQIRTLHEHYPGAPLWALKLADHLRDRLGRYAESAAVAREVVAAAQRGDDNFGPMAGALGYLAEGQALLLDLRLPEARRALLSARGDLPPALLPRVRLWLGRTLELEGDREAALIHYQAAAASSEKDVRRAAQQALDTPIPTVEIAATPHLAEARRLREAGHLRESMAEYQQALAIDSNCAEARLRVAEDDLRHANLVPARAALRGLASLDAPRPPWVRPWQRLLGGYLFDLENQREAALKQYKDVLQEPYGDPDLVREATIRGRHPYHLAPPPEKPSTSPTPY